MSRIRNALVTGGIGVLPLAIPLLLIAILIDPAAKNSANYSFLVVAPAAFASLPWGLFLMSSEAIVKNIVPPELEELVVALLLIFCFYVNAFLMRLVKWPLVLLVAGSSILAVPMFIFLFSAGN